MTTTTQFLKRVKAAALVPTHQIAYSDQDILDIANEEMDNLLVPEIMSLREEYLVTKTTVPMVVGEDTIDIPYRAVGRTIREIKISTSTASTPNSLPRASITEDIAMSSKPGKPLYHYFEGDSIKVNPVPDQVYGDYLLWWEARPNRLTLATQVGIISYITDTTITVQQNLTSSITTGSIVDIVSAIPGYKTIYTDISVGSISTGLGPKILTLSSFSPSNPITGVAVGDHMSLAWTSDIIQLPDEAVQVLVQATALRMLQGQDQEQQFALTEKMLDRCLKSMRKAMTPRNEGASVKIRKRNSPFGPGRRWSIANSSN